jgi:nucleotide-binding universal stress UspA family protein
LSAVPLSRPFFFIPSDVNQNQDHHFEAGTKTKRDLQMGCDWRSRVGEANSGSEHPKLLASNRACIDPALFYQSGKRRGLVLPPKLAPVQVVIVPIYKKDAERATVMEAIAKITAEWRGKIRFHLDMRDHLTPGLKFNEWELKGVPLRMEVGPQDIEKQSVALAQRVMLDTSATQGQKTKSFVPQAGLTEHIMALMDQIQQGLYQRALKFREEHTFEAKTYDELKEYVELGFVRCWWAGSREDEERIQEETKATIRVIPLDQPGDKGKCVYTGNVRGRAWREMQKLDADFLAEALPEDVPRQLLVERGKTWPVISGVLKKNNIDLIVMGTHGRTGLEILLLGSFAETVFRRATCPVLTVGPQNRPATSSSALKNVLFATDFSEESKAAEPYAFSIARRRGAKLSLLNVVKPGFAGLQADDKALSYAQAQLRATASYAASRRLGPVANLFTEIGPVVETVVKLAIRLKADLIVLGASAPRTLPDRLGGTTAYRVVCTAACPVLTVRAPSPLAYFERLFAVMPKT